MDICYGKNEVSKGKWNYNLGICPLYPICYSFLVGNSSWFMIIMWVFISANCQPQLRGHPNWWYFRHSWHSKLWTRVACDQWHDKRKQADQRMYNLILLIARQHAKIKFKNTDPKRPHRSSGIFTKFDHGTWKVTCPKRKNTFSKYHFSGAPLKLWEGCNLPAYVRKRWFGKSTSILGFLEQVPRFTSPYHLCTPMQTCAVQTRPLQNI